jgi:ribosomal protein L29
MSRSRAGPDTSVRKKDHEELQDEYNELKKKYQLLRRSLKVNGWYKEHYENKIQDAKEELEEKDKAIQALSRRTDELQAHCKQQQVTLTNVLAHNRELKENQSHLEKSVRDAQQTAFHMLDKAEWVPQQDSDVRREINIIEKLVKDWSKATSKPLAKQWYCQNMTVDATVDLQEDVLAVSAYANGVPKGFETGAMDKKCWMLLSALLNQFICRNFYAEPFIFFDSFLNTSESIMVLDPFEKNRSMGSTKRFHDIMLDSTSTNIRVVKYS